MYQGHAKQLVYRLKFARARAAADTLAAVMAARVRLDHRDALVVPIPTATSRVRLRGYDQAALIASSLGRQWQLPYARILVRHGQARQVGAKREVRLQQLAGAFLLPSPAAVRDRHIVLVDDVITTGATIEEAARTLLQAGAKTVRVVAFAGA